MIWSCVNLVWLATPFALRGRVWYNVSIGLVLVECLDAIIETTSHDLVPSHCNMANSCPSFSLMQMIDRIIGGHILP